MYNSGWINIPIWEDTGLAADTMYTYRVRARDKSVNHNQTGWSALLDANTLPEGEVVDENPPAPVAWEVLPYETGSGLYAYANMTAAEATDPEGSTVLYYFECTEIPSINSGWTTERVWNNVYIGPWQQGLHFHFKVADSIDGVNPQNQSDWSTTVICLRFF
jgi:hypothetical protein